MRQKTVIIKLLESVTETCYKVRQVLQNASEITKCDRLLLQSASGITNITILFSFLKGQKQELSFQLWFIASRALLQRHVKSNRLL